MDIQVISFIDREFIDFQGINYIFKEEDKDKAYSKEYYIFNEKKIEIIFIKKDTYITTYKNQNVKKVVILTNDVQAYKIEDSFTNRNIIFTGSRNTKLNNAILLNQMLNKEMIHFKALIMLICDDEAYSRLKSIDNINMLILGSGKKDKVITNIVMNTLKEMSIIEKSNSIELFLYTNDELQLTDLINIEDPICEYINCGKLKIKQCLLKSEENSIYYTVLARTK